MWLPGGRRKENSRSSKIWVRHEHFVKVAFLSRGKQWIVVWQQNDVTRTHIPFIRRRCLTESHIRFSKGFLRTETERTKGHVASSPEATCQWLWGSSGHLARSISTDKHLPGSPVTVTYVLRALTDCSSQEGEGDTMPCWCRYKIAAFQWPSCSLWGVEPS